MSTKNFDVFSNSDVIGNVRSFGNVLVINKGYISVQLHGNEVAKVDNVNRMVTLSNCGWPTVTTNKVINETLRQLGSYIRVKTVKGKTMLQLDTTQSLEVLVNGDSFRF